MKVLFLAALCFVASQEVSADDDEATETSSSPWQKSTDSVASRLSHLLNHGYYSDIKVTVGNETFDLHRIVLAMTSHVWEALLFPKNDASSSSVQSLTIENLQPSTFRHLLSYVYEDRTTFDSMTVVWDLWKVAVRYEIQDLVQKTAQHINGGITDDNVLEALTQAVANNETHLEELCLEIIENSAGTILNQASFLQLDQEIVGTIVKSPLLNASEVDIFRSVFQWAKTSLWKDDIPATSENLNKRLENILPHVDLDSVTPDEFVQHVQPTGLLSPESSNLRMRAMLLKLLPTDQTSVTRREAAFRNPQTCWRWKNVRIEELTYVAQAPKQQHVLRFTVDCGRPTCYLISVQVTLSYGDYECENVDVRNSVPFSLSDVVTGRTLAEGVYPLTREMNYTISLTPVKLTSNKTYRIQIDVEDYYEMTQSDSQQRCRRLYLHRSNFAYEKGFSHGTDFSSVVDCGGTSVQFMNDPESNATTVEKGLIAKMDFI